MNRIVKVSELIEQLQKYDGEALVYTEDTEEGSLVGVRGAYVIDVGNIQSANQMYDGQVYLGIVD